MADDIGGEDDATQLRVALERLQPPLDAPPLVAR
jgi:hypothetical protein